jgi:hypothetical protein
MAALRQQATILSIQGLISDANDKCVKKCITSPGTALSNGEKQVIGVFKETNYRGY